jgi:hypothetical protein
MKIFKFRVIIDTEQDVFRDIEINTMSTFEELHRAILKAFDWDEGEMASFYKSNDQWERGLEIPLMDMGDDLVETEEDTPPTVSMSTLKLNQIVSKPDEKMVYVYDFMRMWCFYIELQAVTKAAPSVLYPRVTMVFGDAPEMTSKEFDLFTMPADDGDDDSYELTGDPEIDEYLQGGSDDDGYDEYTSLDDLDI